MLRAEIGLFLVMAFIAYFYFSAEKKHSLLHETFSALLPPLQPASIRAAANIITVSFISQSLFSAKLMFLRFTKPVHGFISP